MTAAVVQPASSAAPRPWYSCRLRVLLPYFVIFTIVAVCFVFWLQHKKAEAAIKMLGGRIRHSSKSAWDAEDTSNWPAYAKDKWNSRSSKSRSGFGSPVLADGFEVDLAGVGTADAGLATVHFRALWSLRTLNLSYSNVTDAGLQYIEGLGGLRALDLAGTRTTDSGLKHLKGLTQLQWLCLRNTHVTDVGMTDLEAITNLQWLNLSKTSVPDTGLIRLAALRRLERLYLLRTDCTDEGVNALQQQLPKCIIEWDLSQSPNR